MHPLETLYVFFYIRPQMARLGFSFTAIFSFLLIPRRDSNPRGVAPDWDPLNDALPTELQRRRFFMRNFAKTWRQNIGCEIFVKIKVKKAEAKQAASRWNQEKMRKNEHRVVDNQFFSCAVIFHFGSKDFRQNSFSELVWSWFKFGELFYPCIFWKSFNRACWQGWRARVRIPARRHFSCKNDQLIPSHSRSILIG